MSELVPCPGCNRDVKSGEATCPFCQAAVFPTEEVMAPIRV